jgi:hypothetical protein
MFILMLILKTKVLVCVLHILKLDSGLYCDVAAGNSLLQ